MYQPPRELPVGARQWAEHRHIPSERRTEMFFRVGCVGYARYSVYECRETGTRVVPQRYVTPLSLMIGTKALFLYLEVS